MKKLLFTLLMFCTTVILAQNYWQQINGMYGGRVISLGSDSLRTFAGTTFGGLYYSEDEGDSWQFINDKLLMNSSISDIKFNSSGTIFCLINNYRPDGGSYLVYSPDRGSSWLNTSFQTMPWCFAINKNDWLFVAQNGAGASSGIWRSKNNGQSWEELTNGFTSTESRWISSIIVDGDNVIYLGTHEGVWKSINNGNEWIKASQGLPSGEITSLVSLSNKLFASIRNGGIYTSTDKGLSWTYDLPSYWVNTVTINSMAKHGTNTVYAAADTYGIIHTIDAGTTWNQFREGLSQGSYYSITINNSGRIFAGSYGDGIFAKALDDTVWEKKNYGLKSVWVQTILATKNRIFAGVEGGGIFYLDRGQADWSNINYFDPTSPTGFSYPPYVRTLEKDSNENIYMGVGAGSSFGGVYKSTDLGVTWNSIGLTPYSINKIFFNDNTNTLLVATDRDGIFFSTDYGNSWQNASISNKYIRAFCGIRNNNLLAGSWSGIFKSTDNGITWSSSGLSNLFIYSFASNSIGQIFVTTSDGIYRSENDGSTWNKINSPTSQFITFNKIMINSLDYIFIGSESGGVYYSKNNGKDWSKIDSGLSNTLTTTIICDSDGYLYLGTKGAGVFRSIAKSTTNVNSKNSNLPLDFLLYQNYPNPFNPSTTIKYSLPPVDRNGISTYKVVLKVYDLLGREVATLVNEEKAPGNYEVTFNAETAQPEVGKRGESLPSGVYFYVLSTNGFFQSKKMILVK